MEIALIYICIYICGYIHRHRCKLASVSLVSSACINIGAGPWNHYCSQQLEQLGACVNINYLHGVFSAKRLACGRYVFVKCYYKHICFTFFQNLFKNQSCIYLFFFYRLEINIFDFNGIHEFYF